MENIIEFTARQVIVEFWISFVSACGVETGIIVKKLSDGTYLIPSGTKKKVFVLEELELITASDNGFVHLPFLIGTTDFPATDAMKTETHNSFIKAFRVAFCLPVPEPSK